MTHSSSRFLFQRVIRRCNFKLALLCIAFWVGGDFAEAQSQKQLEDQRARLTREINETSRLLEASSQTRESALDRLVGLQRQIIQREELIVLLRLQVAHADSSVGRTTRVLSSMQADVDTLAAEYGRMARAALRQGFLNDRLAFLLTSESFSEALARTRYLRQYDENRRRQLELIQITRNALQKKVNKLDDIRLEKEKLLLAELDQQRILEQSLADKNALLESLADDEDRLRRELAEQTKDKNQLDRAIGDVIQQRRVAVKNNQRFRESSETSKRVSERTPVIASAKPTVPKKITSSTTSTSTGTSRVQDFSKNQGRLPWPVEGGFISKPYGERAHPTLKSVKVHNNGVDIRTDPRAAVKAIFEGEVVGLQAIPGYNYMVILQHGDYFSVYSNLIDVRVKSGALVEALDIIGTVATNASTNTSELHFEVWKARQTQNPTRWLKR